MTLPKKAEKGYLKVERSQDRPCIVGQRERLAELAPLFAQRGIPCQRHSTTPGGQQTLLFDPDADVAALTEILDAYQSAKGS
jgi:hypothetical protein